MVQMMTSPRAGSRLSCLCVRDGSCRRQRRRRRAVRRAVWWMRSCLTTTTRCRTCFSVIWAISCPPRVALRCTAHEWRGHSRLCWVCCAGRALCVCASVRCVHAVCVLCVRALRAVLRACCACFVRAVRPRACFPLFACSLPRQLRLPGRACGRARLHVVTV